MGLPRLSRKEPGFESQPSGIRSKAAALYDAATEQFMNPLLATHGKVDKSSKALHARSCMHARCHSSKWNRPAQCSLVTASPPPWHAWSCPLTTLAASCSVEIPRRRLQFAREERRRQARQVSGSISASSTRQLQRLLPVYHHVLHLDHEWGSLVLNAERSFSACRASDP